MNRQRQQDSKFERGLREWESMEEVPAPVRTRGAIRTRGSMPAGASAQPIVRTRGAIRTRGPAAPPRPLIWSLEELVQDLDSQVGGLPLVIVLEGWPGESVEDFWKHWQNALRAVEYTVWFVGHRELEASQTAVIESESRVYLNLEREDDKGLYRNLIGDLVFVPGGSSKLASLAKDWGKRARAIVVNIPSGELSGVVRTEAADISAAFYSWDGENLEVPSSR